MNVYVVSFVVHYEASTVRAVFQNRIDAIKYVQIQTSESYDKYALKVDKDEYTCYGGTGTDYEIERFELDIEMPTSSPTDDKK